MERLLEERVELSRELGKILADTNRYNSPEFDKCINEIHRVEGEIRAGDIDPSPIFELIAGAARIDQVVALE